MLDENKYLPEVFGALYFLRWQIETRYDVLKNCFQLECFSGNSPQIVLQDFYIILLIANLQMLLADEVNQELTTKSTQRKHQYQVNISVSLLKNQITELLLGNKNSKNTIKTQRCFFAKH